MEKFDLRPSGEFGNGNYTGVRHRESIFRETHAHSLQNDVGAK